MGKVLKATKFLEQLQELTTTDFNITASRGNPVLEQTKKNNARADLIDGLAVYLQELLNGHANVYQVQEGIAIEVDSDAVAAKYPEGNGMITMVLDLTVKSLDYDAYMEADLYAEERAAKEKKKLQIAAEKEDKIKKAMEKSKK